MCKKIKIFIAEGPKLIRDGYISILKENPAFSIIGEAGNGKEVIEQLEQKEPDILILAIEMPVMGGFEALLIIKKRFPKVKVLMVSFHDEKVYTAHCIKKGANGYLTKNGSGEELINALLILHQEGFFFDKIVSGIMISDALEEDILSHFLKNAKLSSLEIQILKLFWEDKQNKEMAEILNLSIYSIEHYRKSIYKKTSSKTVGGALKYAIRNKIIRFESAFV